jgi:hypothetical protein
MKLVFQVAGGILLAAMAVYFGDSMLQASAPFLTDLHYAIR